MSSQGSQISDILSNQDPVVDEHPHITTWEQFYNLFVLRSPVDQTASCYEYKQYFEILPQQEDVDVRKQLMNKAAKDVKDSIDYVWKIKLYQLIIFSKGNKYFMLVKWCPSEAVRNQVAYIDCKKSAIMATTKKGFAWSNLETKHVYAQYITDIASTKVEVFYDSHDKVPSQKQTSEVKETVLKGYNHKLIKCATVSEPFTLEQCVELDKMFNARQQGVQLRVYNSNVGKVQLLVLQSNEGGLSRQYFDKTRAGHTILQKFGPREVSNYVNEENFFKIHQPTSAFYGDGNTLQQFIVDKQVEDISSCIKLQGRQQQVFNMYDDLLKQGEFVHPSVFTKSLAYDQKLLRAAMKEKDSLRDLYAMHSYNRLEDQQIIDPIETLKEYCKEHPIPDEERLTNGYLRTLQLYEAFQAIFKCVVLREYAKKGAVFLYGPSNAGKTSIIRLLQRIFHTQYYLPQGKFDPDDIIPKDTPQVLLMDEFDTLKKFKEHGLIKTLLAREGKRVEVKFRSPVYLFKGSSIVMTANDLKYPEVLTPNDIEAIEVRMYIVLMTKVISLQAGFPITAPQLAHYFLRMCRKRQTAFEDLMDSEVEQEEQKVKFVGDVLLQAPLVGTKRTHTKRNQYNSLDQEKKTARAVEWKSQYIIPDIIKDGCITSTPALIGCGAKFAKEEIEYIEDKLSDTEMTEATRFVKPKQNKEEEDTFYEPIPPNDQSLYPLYNRDMFFTYYKTRMPEVVLERLYCFLLNHREFATEISKYESERKFDRYRGFNTMIDLQMYLRKTVPYAIYNGAIYTKPLKESRNDEWRKLEIKAADLSFDLDANDYDDVRDCCQKKTLCDKCSNEILLPVVNLIINECKSFFNFQHILPTFSGGRGFHVRVLDDSVRLLDIVERKMIIEHLKDVAADFGIPFRIDEGVTTDRTKLLRMPYSIHPGTLKIVVPIDPQQHFKYQEIPTVQEVIKNRTALKKYNQIFYEQFTSSYKHTDKFAHSKSAGRAWLDEQCRNYKAQKISIMQTLGQTGDKEDQEMKVDNFSLMQQHQDRFKEILE